MKFEPRNLNPETRRVVHGKLFAWLQLIRLPNLLTVPGDPLAGYFLAAAGDISIGSILLAVVASLFLYIFGLISNDIFDFKDDRNERPDRPLPSGRIGKVEATIVAGVLVVAAIVLAAVNGVASFIVALILATVIVIYNSGGKKIPFAGPVNMGLCRGLSLLLGASAGGRTLFMSRPVLFAAAAIAFYIVAVTVIAAKETVRVRIGSKRWWPAFAVTLLLIPLYGSSNCASYPLAAKVFSFCLAAGALLWSWNAGTLLAGTPAPGTVPVVIGKFIQGLLIIQALLLSLCEWPAQAVAACIIIVLPVFSVLARKFYSS